MKLRMICKKTFIIITLAFVFLSSFSVISIPFLYWFCFCFFFSQIATKLNLLLLATISISMLFGGLFISLAIADKVLDYFVKLFFCEEHLQSKNKEATNE